MSNALSCPCFTHRCNTVCLQSTFSLAGEGFNSMSSFKISTCPFMAAMWIGFMAAMWNMPQLRVIIMDRLCLSNPPSDGIIMENLQTLLTLQNFKCIEEVVQRIPHIKLLGLFYVEVEESSFGDYYLNNLDRLQELEHLEFEVQVQSQRALNLFINFPFSLKFLHLNGIAFHWDDVATKIGSLPLLQHLVLDQDSCIGAQWETVEGQFCSLQLLEIKGCGDLEYWITEASHFPRLEQLYIEDLHKLCEIPSSIGDVPTLQLIEVENCSDSACDSVERIKEEQEELGNEDLQIQVRRLKRFKERDIFGCRG